MTVVVNVQWSQLDLFRLKKTLGNMKPVFAGIGTEVLKAIGQNFDAQGAWSRWAPLRPNTIAGRRQGGSSKALQTSGKLRASFRMEAGTSQVTIGSPLKTAMWHHEGRGVAVGGAKWKIVPKHGKALAFPVAQGGAPAGRAVVTAGAFKSYGYKKRSKAFLSGVPMAVVRSVMHPGYPSRPLLPPEWKAAEIATAVAQKFLDMAKGA